MTRNQIIQQYVRVNRKYEDQFLPVIRRAIHAKVLRVIAALKEGGVPAANNYLLSDIGNASMGEAIKTLYIMVGRKHAQLNYSRLLHDTRRRKSVDMQLQSKGFGYNAQWVAFILNYLSRFLLDKVTFEIASTTRDAMLKALTEMTTEGLSVDLMIERLKDWPYERFQAARIVRTEVNRAANVGATAQANTSEYQQMKEWVATHDYRTRGQNPKDHASHIGLDGVKINEDDMFTDPRNGDRLMFPGDPNAKAESTINCRCQAVYTFKRDAEGNLIPKRRSTVVIYPGRRQTQTITI